MTNALPQAVVEAALDEAHHWTTGFESHASTSVRYSVIRRDQGGFDQISFHASSAEANTAMERLQIEAALRAAQPHMIHEARAAAFEEAASRLEAINFSPECWKQVVGIVRNLRTRSTSERTSSATESQERFAETRLDQHGFWRCPSCRCHSYARVDEKKGDGAFGPGPHVRCVSCKQVYLMPDSQPGASPEMPGSDHIGDVNKMVAPQAQAVDAREVLRDVEWEREGSCPSCRHWKEYGHAPDCRLAAALRSDRTAELEALLRSAKATVTATMVRAHDAESRTAELEAEVEGLREGSTKVLAIAAEQAIRFGETKAELSAAKFLVADLRAIVRELADDLEGEIDHHYPPEIRNVYPSEMRRYDRDMDTVRRARDLLAKTAPAGTGEA